MIKHNHIKLTLHCYAVSSFDQIKQIVAIYSNVVQISLFCKTNKKKIIDNIINQLLFVLKRN